MTLQNVALYAACKVATRWPRGSRVRVFMALRLDNGRRTYGNRACMKKALTMAKEIDVVLLIASVEAHPILWDKTSPTFKDRDETKQAWKEVCTELNSDFFHYDDEERDEFEKNVVKRWVNIRDAFNKSIKKEQKVNKSGSSTITPKKYVYEKRLQFLYKVFSRQSTKDSLSTTNEDSEPALSKSSNENENGQVRISHENKLVGSCKRKYDDMKLNMINSLVQPEDRHLSFFKGIIPTINTLNEDEILKFQMGVLQLLNNIKQSRNSIHRPNVNIYPSAPLRYISSQRNMTKNRNRLSQVQTTKNLKQTSSCESINLLEDPL